MRFSRIFTTSLAGSLLFLFGTVGYAQTEIPVLPLAVWAAGDLFNIYPDGISRAVRLTQDGTISNPTLSPDGMRIAYRSLAPVAREALGRITTPGFILPTELPTDIYELDRATGAARLFLGQPIAPSLFVEGVVDNATVYGAPAYSADGLSLFIAQSSYPFGADFRPLIDQYPLDAPERGVNIASAAIIEDEGVPPQIVTSVSGIALKTVQAGEDGAWDGDLFVVMPTVGETITHRFYSPERTNIVLFNWARDMRGTGEGWVFFYLAENGAWTVIDPIARTVTENATAPYMVSTANPDNSLRVTFGAFPASATSAGGLFWEATDPSFPEGTSIAYPGAPGGVALSPDGRQIAAVGYPDYGQIGLWERPNAAEPIVRAVSITGLESIPVSALFWGASEWRWNG